MTNYSIYGSPVLPNKESVVNTATDSNVHMYLNSVMTSYPIIVLSPVAAVGRTSMIHSPHVYTVLYFVQNLAHTLGSNKQYVVMETMGFSPADRFV